MIKSCSRSVLSIALTSCHLERSWKRIYLMFTLKYHAAKLDVPTHESRSSTPKSPHHANTSGDVPPSRSSGPPFAGSVAPVSKTHEKLPGHASLFCYMHGPWLTVIWTDFDSSKNLPEAFVDELPHTWLPNLSISIEAMCILANGQFPKRISQRTSAKGTVMSQVEIGSRFVSRMEC